MPALTVCYLTLANIAHVIIPAMDHLLLSTTIDLQGSPSHLVMPLVDLYALNNDLARAARLASLPFLFWKLQYSCRLDLGTSDVTVRGSNGETNKGITSAPEHSYIA